MSKTLMIILILFVVSLNLFAQTTINIPTDYATIQAGLNAANEGDTVLVSQGTYYENIFWPETNSIKLIGQDTSNTIIDGGGISSVISVNPQSTIVDSLTMISHFKIINGGNVDQGGGIMINNSSPIISNCYIKNNKANALGGGIYIGQASSPYILNSIIERNYAGGGTWSRGGAIFVSSGGGSIDNCIIDNNTCSLGAGIYIHEVDIVISNTIIKNHTPNYAIWARRFSGSILNTTFINNSMCIRINYSKPFIQNSKFINNTIGIHSEYSEPKIIGSEFINNKEYALFFNDVSSPEVENCNFIKNGINQLSPFLKITSSTPILVNNNFCRNLSAVYNSTNSNITNASGNYWGAISGPYHSIQNPNGLGDSTNLYVNVTPWLTEPNIDAPPIPIQNLLVTSTTDTEISLTWNKSLIGDLAGYKVYYDIDSTNWEFSNSIDIGLDTNYTLSNLPIGQTYYISVTCYDTDGNESWYSETVSANTTQVPIISVNVDTIDFSSETIEKESAFDIEITNNGTDVLTVFSSQTATNEFYTNQLVELNIIPNETAQLSVYFKPMEIGDYQDELTISSNANNEPQIIIQLNGFGVLPESPTILSIADVPNDQGGKVRIEFSKSRYDQNDDTTNSIASYSIWRLNTNSEWDAIGMFNADRSEKYNYVSTTLGDSTTNGIVWSVFKVSAHSVNPDIFYYSEIDSGYSIDNIAPSVPQGLNANGLSDRVEIAWNSNKEKDFQYYAIYRSTDSEFNPDTMQTYTFTTIDSIYVDNNVNYGVEYYYKISAFDYAGNESEYTESVSALVTEVKKANLLPKKYVLEQNYPNPFNPSTMVKYGLPEQSNIKIEIFNMLGQSVGVLINTEKQAGFYETTWNAGNLPSGIYLISIRAEGLSSKKNFVQVKKALLLK